MTPIHLTLASFDDHGLTHGGLINLVQSERLLCSDFLTELG